MVTVTVVFYRTTTVIFYRFEWLRHLHLHTKTEHGRYLCLLVGCHLLSYFHGTLVIDDISQIQTCRNVLHIIFCIYLYLVAYGFPFERSQLQSRILPSRKLLLQTCTEVIISRRTPEVRCQNSIFIHHFHTCHIVTAQVTTMFVEFQTEVLTVHNQITPVVLLHLRNYSSYVYAFCILQFHWRSLVRIQYKLVFRYGISGRK